MQGVPDSSMRAKGGRKARHELEQALSDDKDDHAARFALVQLLAITGEYSAADVSEEKEISTTMYTMHPIEKHVRKNTTQIA